jgi:serine/threonine-protein kinase RsbW
MLRQIKIESNIGNLGVVENIIDSITFEMGINQESYGKILVAVLEAVNNAIVHGNKSDVSKNVELDFSTIRRNLYVSVTDEGIGFDPKKVPDPTKPENIEAINGRGVFLMSKLADEIEFNTRGNSVKLIFKNIVP